MNLYIKYLQWNNKFWDKIMGCKTPKRMSQAIYSEFMRRTPLFFESSKEEVGRWTINFAQLAEDLKYTKSREVALHKIRNFREQSACDKDENRTPEDQSALFKGPLWTQQHGFTVERK